MFLMKQKMFLGVSSLENSTWDIFFVGGGVLFSLGTFSVLLETLGILMAFDFYPHSIIPVKSGVPPCAY